MTGDPPPPPSRRRRPAAAAALAVAAALALGGCTATDQLASDFRSGDGAGTGDARVTEFPAGERGDPISFRAPDASGAVVTAEQFRGEVLVVNFWYAACGPCRLEAKDLREVSAATTDTATFLGVDTRDSADSVRAFGDAYDIPYANALDVEDNAAQLPFAARTAPNTTPSTLVLDPEGRVSSRILGPVDPSTLTTLIAAAAS